MKIPTLVLKNGTRLPLTARWRKSGGRVMHAVAVVAVKGSTYVVSACEHRTISAVEEELPSSDEPVTCRRCLDKFAATGLAQTDIP